MKSGFLNRAKKQTQQRPPIQKNSQRQQDNKQAEGFSIQKPSLGQKISLAQIDEEYKSQYEKIQTLEHMANEKTQYSIAQTCINQPSEKEKVEQEKIIKQYQAKFYLNEILQFIYDVADRNEVYRANFIHLHIPLALVLKLLDIQSNTNQVTYLKSVIHAILQKVKTHKTMKQQLSNKEFYNEFFILIAKPTITEDEILQFLRNFLEANKEIMKGVMPYYYNYFALVVNKEIVFRGSPGILLEYTIDYKHEEFYQGDFKRTNISDILNIFEKKLVEKYHSNEI